MLNMLAALIILVLLVFLAVTIGKMVGMALLVIILSPLILWRVVSDRFMRFRDDRWRRKFYGPGAMPFMSKR